MVDTDNVVAVAVGGAETVVVGVIEGSETRTVVVVVVGVRRFGCSVVVEEDGGTVETVVVMVDDGLPVVEVSRVVVEQ